MNTSAEVDAWFAKSDHPMKAEMMRVREIVLRADSRMTECIKWKTPTFMHEGNLASFNPNTKAHVSLMFHTGAKIPGKHRRLLGGGGTARYMKLADMADVESAVGDLQAVVDAWIAMKDGSGAAAKKKTAKKKTAKKKTAKKKTAKKKTAKKKTAKKKTAKKKTAKKKTAKKKTAKKKTAKKKTAKKKTAKRS